jgi:demethylmenaquinone methyltransferase/2-methoxy-6-polyprenyl-1,4-benzoquinol methylase
VDAQGAREIFDRNAVNYDWVNSIISLGLDKSWRRWVAKQATEGPGMRILDAFSGTGLVALEEAAMGADVTAADISPQMLSIASGRAERRGISIDIKLVDLTGDHLPLEEEYFDAITLVFGIRYLKNPAVTISKLSSFLKPDGRLIALEFIMPASGFIPTLASLYFFRILPRIGSLLAGRRELYDYLISSTSALGHKENLLKIISSAGLNIIETELFGFGLVCGVIATK